MPSIELNRKVWGDKNAWSENGDEWSEAWGSAEAQWFGSILPRVHAFIPANNILEIAPGYGRWTQYLKDHCRNLSIVDLNSNCIEKCRNRFAQSSHINYHVNDGLSLEMIADNSIDFAFSFDSLVHAEMDVLESYLKQLAGKLTPDGIGFFHHSNLGEYQERRHFTNKLPQIIQRILARRKMPDIDHWRSPGVTAAKFNEACDAAGLSCISQELVNWHQKRLIDAFSIFTRKGSKWERPNKIMRNYSFMMEAKQLAELSKLYSFVK